MKRFATLVLVIVALVGACAGQQDPSHLPVHGDTIERPAKPSEAECDARLRSEQAAAEQIRRELRVDGIRFDPATIKAVAADPAATTAALGIPLNAAEADALRGSGIAIDDTTAMGFWVNVGAMERFGGIWIDPPGSSHYVIAVVNGDEEALALARCFEGPDVRYVWANLSIGDGRALATRIGNDMQAMRAAGIEINSVGYQENEGTVIVGVAHPTDELERLMIEKYGGPLRLEEAGPAVPD